MYLPVSGSLVFYQIWSFSSFLEWAVLRRFFPQLVFPCQFLGREKYWLEVVLRKYKEYNYEKNKKILGAQQRFTTDKDWPILTILGRDQKIHFISSLIRPHLDILQNNGDDIIINMITWFW